MEPIIIVLIAVLGTWAVYSLLDTQDKDIQARLERLGSITQTQEDKAAPQVFNEELQKPLAERIFLPVVRMLAQLVQKNTKGDTISNLQKQLAMAGYPGNLRPQDFLAIQYAWLIASVGIAAFVTIRVLKSPPNDMVMYLAGGIIAGILGPRLFLQRRIAERQRLIQLGLADLLDLLTVSVEAGLGFDAGISRCIEKLVGPLSDEFRTVLREIRVGKSRKQALRDAAERIKVHDIDVFFSAIIQAEQLGVSLAKVLRVQSEQLRQKRRQRAEEMAQKAPIKMMFPLVIFVFPTIFIVLMGPAILNAMKIFATSGPKQN